MNSNVNRSKNITSNTLSKRMAQEKEVCRLSKDLLRNCPSTNKALRQELYIQYKALKKTEECFKLDFNHWNGGDETDADQMQSLDFKTFLYDQIYPIKEANLKLKMKLRGQVSLSELVKCFENLRRNKQKLQYLKELLSDTKSHLTMDMPVLSPQQETSSIMVSLRILGCDQISRSFSEKSIITGLPSVIKRSLQKCPSLESGENINAKVRCDLLIRGRVILSTVAREPSPHCWNTIFTYKHDPRNPLEIQVVWMSPYPQLTHTIKKQTPHYGLLDFILSGLIYVPLSQEHNSGFIFRTVNLYPEGKVLLETQIIPVRPTPKKRNPLPRTSLDTNTTPSRPLSTAVPKTTTSAFNLIALLGTGHFGKIVLCKMMSDRRYYAMKIIKKKDVLESDEYEQIVAEKTVLEVIKAKNHPLMVHLISCLQDSGHIMFVLEFIQGGDLITLIDRMHAFSHEQAQFYVASAVLCIEFLHKNNIMYRDLKLENLLLDAQGYVKLVDFGLCKLNMGKEGYTRTLCGTIDYMAPEVYSGTGYTRVVDWWTVGVLLYYMLVGDVPFFGENESESVDAILHKAVTIPTSMDAITSSFIISLLNKNPKSRLGSRNGAVEVKVHPFFAIIDFDRILRRRVVAPFVPDLRHNLDLKFFDHQFTSQKPTLSVTEVDLTNHPDAKSFFDEFV